MQSTIDELERKVFLESGVEILLSDGRTVVVPRWSARTALTLGKKLGDALGTAGSGGGADRLKALFQLMPLLGEVVCETLGESDEFLDSITKDDLFELGLAIFNQEFRSESFASISKKAAALLPPQDSGA